FIPRKAATLPILEKLAAELGTNFTGCTVAPGAEAAAVQPVRIALVDRIGGSMTSGWTRRALGRFEYPFKVRPAEELAAGGLGRDFDVLLLVEEAMVSGPMKEQVPQFKRFLENGGTIIAIGQSTSLGKDLGLPLASHLATKDEEGGVSQLPREKYYVPSS